LSGYAEEREKIVAIPVLENMETKAVKKTVSLPRWLDSQSKRDSMNCSRILQDGIMERLKNQQDGRQAKRAESRCWCIEIGSFSALHRYDLRDAAFAEEHPSPVESDDASPANAHCASPRAPS
jgi:post-segregation antitoxin (ccd killing protein)